MPFRWKSVKKRLRNARQAGREFLAAGGVGLRFKGSVEEGSLTAELRIGDRRIPDRFITLMQPFLSRASDYSYGQIWERVQREMDITPEEKAAVDLHIATAERGHLPLELNEELLSAKKLHTLVADGQFFDQDSTAIAEAARLCEAPLLRPVLWFQFYTFPLDVLGVVARLDRIRSRTALPASPATGKCIFCLREHGPFASEEHIIAEALGFDDELILRPGIVCDPCNHGVLSRLDQALVEFAPVAALRTWYVPFTKHGKLPHAEFVDGTWTKTRPNHIELRLDEPPLKQALADGSTQFQITCEGRRSIPPRLVARALYKVGLELVALDCGLEQALDPRYDLARRFVLGDSPTFPNTLMFMTEGVPRPEVHTHLTRDFGGTALALDIFGFRSFVNLEPEPRISSQRFPTDAPFQFFPLDEPASSPA